jgi:hypothetical protein
MEKFDQLINEERSVVRHNQAAEIDDQFVSKIEQLSREAKYTTPLKTDVEVNENQMFATRFEAGRYLNSILPEDSSEISYKNTGLWTWLSALYFRQLVEPKKEHGKFNLWSSPRYVFLNETRRFYRHLLFTPFWICRTEGEVVAKFFVSVAPYTGGDTVEQLYSRAKFFVQIPSLVEAAIDLYVDPKTNKLKSGINSKNKPGGAIRLAMNIPQQLEMTYDLSSMTKDEILEILPDEFDAWRS